VDYLTNFTRKSDVEDMIERDERNLGISETLFTTFIYNVKRYGYKDVPFDDKIFSSMCPTLGIDHSQFDNENAEDATNPVCQVYKSSFMFNKGTWDIKKLITLGFLYCQH
jgi:hypothetical protein